MRIGEAIFNEIQVSGHDFDLDSEDMCDVLWSLAATECGYDPDELDDERMDEVEECESGIIRVCRIDWDSLLMDALCEWYNTNDRSKVAEHVRSAVNADDMDDNTRYMYWVTGLGYDTISADLLGGDASGDAAKAFIKFLNS